MLLSEVMNILYKNMSKSVLLGPYVGDFTQEVLTFRPYINYITHTLADERVYVSSHSNRSFMYEWVDPDNFLPIYEHISRDEIGQTGFTFDEITKTEFNQISKKIRAQIDSDDVTVHTLPYIKNTNSISYYQKVFTPFDVPDYDIGYDPDIVAIFDKSEQSEEVFNLIDGYFDVTVIGDMNNGMEQHNIMMKVLDFNNKYLIMFNYIMKANLVVTNCRDWALICNCQGIPVLYWGVDSSLFKTGAIMNFNNKKCKSICTMDSGSVFDMIKYGYNEINGD